MTDISAFCVPAPTALTLLNRMPAISCLTLEENCLRWRKCWLKIESGGQPVLHNNRASEAEDDLQGDVWQSVADRTAPGNLGNRISEIQIRPGRKSPVETGANMNN